MLVGTGRFVDAHTIEVVDEHGKGSKVPADKIIIATGTRPARPGSVEFDDRTVIDSDGMIRLDRDPPDGPLRGVSETSGHGGARATGG
ncbi:hypothetical protein AB0B89_11395 [Sphaerisporangium sp. NPDC049002]|uniref:hypothetical protein n=1 Tax=Sphaerisporangium sp. NPDC049002 TaxID=3155392 RepID=UPI0033FF2F60